jgi:hypothetical protein
MAKRSGKYRTNELYSSMYLAPQRNTPDAKATATLGAVYFAGQHFAGFVAGSYLKHMLR